MCLSIHIMLFITFDLKEYILSDQKEYTSGICMSGICSIYVKEYTSGIYIHDIPIFEYNE